MVSGIATRYGKAMVIMRHFSECIKFYFSDDFQQIPDQFLNSEIVVPSMLVNIVVAAVHCVYR